MLKVHILIYNYGKQNRLSQSDCFGDHLTITPTPSIFEEKNKIKGGRGGFRGRQIKYGKPPVVRLLKNNEEIVFLALQSRLQSIYKVGRCLSVCSFIRMKLEI